MPDDSSDAQASRLRRLQRIADALAVPVGALYESEDMAADRIDGACRDDARAMLMAFVRIRDPEQRRACLSYARAIVSGEEGAAGD